MKKDKFAAEGVLGWTTFISYARSKGLHSHKDKGWFDLLYHFCYLHWLAGNLIIARREWTKYLSDDAMYDEYGGFRSSFTEVEIHWVAKRFEAILLKQIDGHYKQMPEVYITPLDLCKLLRSEVNNIFWSPAFGTVILDSITPDALSFSNKIYGHRIVFTLNSHGIISTYADETSECMIFPSKDQRDWTKYNPCKFKEGELVWTRDVDSCFWIARYHTGKMKDGLNLVYYSQTNLATPIAINQCVKYDERPF